MSTDREPGVVSKPPDDNVAIGESPDGDRISGDQARQLLLSKRDLLKGLGALSVLAAIAEGSIGGSGTDTLYGGIMALDKAYKVGERTYMGPDDVKDGVISSIPDSEGWLYRASDTEVDYWLDDNAWQGPMGVGSSGTKAGSSHFQSLSTERIGDTHEIKSSYDDVEIQEIIDNNAVAGDEIHFREGTFDITTAVGSGTPVNAIEVPAGKPLLITGMGRGSVLKVPDGQLPAGEGAQVLTVNAKGTVVKDIKIDGNHQNNSPNTSLDGHNLNFKVGECTAINVVSNNATGDGLGGTGDDLKYIGCTAKNAFEQCMHLAWGSGILVDSCYLGSTENGGCFDTTSFAGKVLENVELRNLVVDGGSGSEDAAIYIRSGEGTVRNIFGSATVIDSAGYGAWVTGNQTGAEGVPDGINIDLEIRAAQDDAYRIEDVGDVTFAGHTHTDSHGVLIDPNSDTGIIDLSGVKLLSIGLASASHGVFVSAGSNNVELKCPQIIREGTGGDLFNSILINDLGASSTVHIVGCDIEAGSNATLAGNSDPTHVRDNVPAIPVDVTTLAAEEGNQAYHDGSHSDTEGPAFYDGTGWVSVVDGTTIAV